MKQMNDLGVNTGQTNMDYTNDPENVSVGTLMEQIEKRKQDESLPVLQDTGTYSPMWLEFNVTPLF